MFHKVHKEQNLIVVFWFPWLTILEIVSPYEVPHGAVVADDVVQPGEVYFVELISILLQILMQLAFISY